jgi:hypothetical protein
MIRPVPVSIPATSTSDIPQIESRPVVVDLALRRPVLTFFAVGLIVMSLMGTVVVVCRDVYKLNLGEFGRLFDLDAEQNVPTWFQVIQLFCAGIVAGVVAFAMQARRDARWIYFAGVAVVLAVLSADELAGFHERISAFISWLKLSKIVLAAIGLLYLRFWWSLPVRFRVLLLVSCIVYFGSAMELDVLSFRFWNPDPAQRPIYDAISIVEETGEMIGAWLFLSTLLAYLQQTGVRMQLRLD